MYHCVMIQSTYDDPELSRYRLDVSLKTSVPSLASQTLKPIVHISLNMADPHYEERLRAFRETGCQVVPALRINEEGWHLPSGRRVMHRLDDDDCISRDFCERTFTKVPMSGDVAMIWPNGYVFHSGRYHYMKHMGNQFVTIVTDRDFHPHVPNHHDYNRLPSWRKVMVSNSPGWIWVRHQHTLSQTNRKYIDRQFTMTLDARFAGCL